MVPSKTDHLQRTTYNGPARVEMAPEAVPLIAFQRQRRHSNLGTASGTNPANAPVLLVACIGTARRSCRGAAAHSSSPVQASVAEFRRRTPASDGPRKRQRPARTRLLPRRECGRPRVRGGVLARCVHAAAIRSAAGSSMVSSRH
jgi:hypothetical protein